MIICQFCQKEPTHAPLKEMEEYKVDVYFCHDCKSEYLVFRDKQFINSVSLYTEINNKTYRVTNIRDAAVQLWYIKTPGIPGTRKNENLEMLVAFKEHLPHVTPENINEKVRNWLLLL
jgi:hypothetical protein